MEFFLTLNVFTLIVFGIFIVVKTIGTIRKACQAQRDKKK